MRKRKQTRRTFEALENRALLTTNVVANVDINGNLTVTGDAGANKVFMQETKTGGWQIQGVNTSINGRSKIVTAPITGNIDVDLGGGKNLFEIQAGTIPGHLSIVTGDLQDQVSAWNLKIGTGFSYVGGGGNDNFWSDQLQLTDPSATFSLNMGDGNDVVNINHSSEHGMSIDLGAGKDKFSMSNTQIMLGVSPQLTILGGAGQDSVALSKVQTSNLTVDMGDGNAGAGSGTKDVLALDRVTADDAVLWDSWSTKGALHGSGDHITTQSIDLIGFSSRSGDLKNPK